MRRPTPLALASLLTLTLPLSARLDPALLAGLELRSIGPATMSGRVVAIDGVAAHPETLYVGAATGGLWKSEDGGLTWKPLFDEEPVASIGAVAVYQPSPDVVWVGTGEGNPRNSASGGDGVYRTLDGGATWSHLGLEKSERIRRIALDPTDRDVAYVAASGTAWGENPERGVYKTVDGGKSWQKVLYVDERSGATDLAIDPTNPQKLFAALWDHRRTPWTFRSGGPGSGLYVTHDGGASWKKLTPEDGLPEGDLGKMGLAIAPSDPSVVYALVEAEKDNVLLRSTDGGASFRVAARSSAERIGNRPFYYAELRVDPQDPNRIYSLSSTVTVSEDGGDSWDTLIPFRSAHPDHHAMWIDPTDPAHLAEGNDGGVYLSRDHGASWEFVRNLPLAQYYHVRTDHETPYNVYGGLQDNGSWKGPSEVWENGGIRNFHWQEVGFGDGFDTVPDPDDPMRGWSMSQEGYLMRYDLRTGERKAVRPAAPPGGEELRFNWNAAIAIDPFDRHTLYFGSQYVHRSTDGGDSWEVLSGDLTTDNPEWQKQAESGGLTPDVTGAENYTTLVAIAPSPVERGVIWTGSDDGRIHLTRDAGATWTSLEANVRGVPKNSWVPHIEPSHFDAATAFVVFDDHRRANWTPYVFKTTDFGASWKSLATPEIRGYCLAIAQDPVDRDLLFLGTEFGLYLSLDGGASWMRWQHGIPTVAVRDLTVQPDDNDLVVATHGRGLFILDDVAPLRGLTDAVTAEPLHLFPIPPAQQHQVAQSGSSRFPGSGEFRGENPPYGALLTYSLNLPGLPHPDDETERARKAEERAKKRQEKETAEKVGEAGAEKRVEPGGEEGGEAAEEGGGRRGRGRRDEGPQVKIEVADGSGEVIRTFDAPAHLGVNRTAWDLKRDAFKEPPREEPRFFEPEGPEVLPGSYTVTLRYKDHKASQTVEVVGDPRYDIPRADREARFARLMEAGALQETASRAIERIQHTRADVKTVLDKVRAAKEEQEKAMKKPDGGEAAEESPAAEEASGEDEAPASPQEELLRAGRKLQKGLDELEKRFWTPPRTKGIVAETDALSDIQRAYGFLGSAWDAPSPTQLGYLAKARSTLTDALTELNRFYAEEVAPFRDKVRAAAVELLPEEEPLTVGEAE